MNYPKNGSELISLFGDMRSEGYFDPVVLNGTKVGFSIQRKYPTGIRFKSAKTKTGEDDNVACIWVVYESSQESNHKELIPIRFHVVMISRYRSRHLFDDDEHDKERPTKESISISQKSPQPIALNLRGGYFYDRCRCVLVDQVGNIVAGTIPLNEIFEAHCKTVHIVFGISFKSREVASRFSRSMLDRLIDGIKWVLKYIFGRTLSERRDNASYFDGYKNSDLGKLPEDYIEVMGYKATKRVVCVFIILAGLVIYSNYPVKDKTYQDFVSHSEALLILHAFAVLFILDIVIPKGLFMILNSIISIRKKYIAWVLKG